MLLACNPCQRQRDGIERWVLIHAEVQGDRRSNFSPDMYTYQYRAYDLKRLPVAGLAILADDESHWRPSVFGYELWGTKLIYQFTVVKLTDYSEADLEKSSNPFAVVTLAHLHAKKTRNRTGDRYQAKWHLVRGLYQDGFSRQQVIDLFRFIDWVMRLPVELDDQLYKEIANFEENKKMPYITSVERSGIRKGMAETLVRQMQRRFGVVPDWASKKVAEADAISLEEWSLRILDTPTLDGVFADCV